MVVAINATIKKCLKTIFRVTPKDYQSNSLAALRRERDVFLSTRTGVGKSLCYQHFPSVWSDLWVCPRVILRNEETSKLYYPLYKRVP